jgi:outer membrane immunogenic protein
MNRLLLLAGAVLALGMSQGAFAADMALKAAPSPPPTWSWTGLYIGGEVGGKWMDNPWTATSLRDPPGPIGGTQLPIDGTSPRNYNGQSARLGGYLGYNWQFSRLLVVGIEGDWAWADSNNAPQGGFPGCSVIGCVAGFAYAPGGPFGGDTTRVNMRWDASVRGRLGFLIAPDVLLYGTGGVTWQEIEADGNCGPFASSFYCNGGGQPSPSNIIQTTTLAGWTAGAGVEVHVYGGLLLRGEYRYSDIGTWNSVFPFGRTTAGDSTYRFQLHPTTNIVTTGVAYKF